MNSTKILFAIYSRDARIRTNNRAEHYFSTTISSNLDRNLSN